MQLRNFLPWVAALLGIAMGLQAAAAPPSAEARAAPGGKDPPEVRALLDRRCEALRKTLEEIRKRIKAGRSRVYDQAGTAWQLLEAELEVAATPADRLA